MRSHPRLEESAPSPVVRPSESMGRAVRPSGSMGRVVRPSGSMGRVVRPPCSPILGLGLACAVWFAVSACGGDDGGTHEYDEYPDASNRGEFADSELEEVYGQPAQPAHGQPSPAQPAGQPPSRADGDPVQLVDHGLRMVRSTLYVPREWRVEQDIATDPQTGQAVRYHVDLLGPRGELVRGTAPVNYFSEMGQDFEQVWRQIAYGSLGGALEDLSIGNLEPSRMLQEFVAFQEVARQTQANALEAPIQGTRQGRPFAGVVYALQIPMPSSPASGTVVLELVVSPRDLLAQTRQIHLQVSNNLETNPQYAQAMQQISSQAMARSSAEHQQRMASNQAQFDAHQRRMQGQQQAFDQTNQQWMNDFRSSGTYGSAGGGAEGYGGHEAYIDQIYERQTFVDPYSGQQVHKDGQYDYNYTNGLGEYYGTNDPNFNPNSLPTGNWEQVQPLKP